MLSGIRHLLQAQSPKLRLVRQFCAVAEVKVDKASLSKLRKKTGFQLMKCKEALVKFNNDVKEAESWMREQAQKEGWAKAGKLAERPMSQGLVGLIEDDNSATIVEVNCETDFVGKTEQFMALVKQVTETCHAHFTQKNELKSLLGKEARELVEQEQNKALGDLVALVVGNIGENMVIRRAAYIQKEPDTLLKTYIHDSGPKLELGNCKFGKFAAIVKMQVPDTDSVAMNICQHVVGMNPKFIGPWVVQKLPRKKQKIEVVAEEEDDLLNQEFLLDPKKTVMQYLLDSGLKVMDFVRLQCGEELPEDD